jgi:hypothetical protein
VQPQQPAANPKGLEEKRVDAISDTSSFRSSLANETRYFSRDDLQGKISWSQRVSLPRLPSITCAVCRCFCGVGSTRISRLESRSQNTSPVDYRTRLRVPKCKEGPKEAHQDHLTCMARMHRTIETRTAFAAQPCIRSRRYC